MGMIFEARRLTAGQAAVLEADPAAAAALEQEGDVLDLDKAWHGIHYLLTGSAWEIPPGVGEAVLGGEPIGEDAGYGPPRLLGADRVQVVAAALREVTAETLGVRFDPGALLAAEIYPQVWDEDDFASYLLPNFLSLRDFYLTAAERNADVLLVIT